MSKFYIFLFIILRKFTISLTKVTDENYALMPDVFVFDNYEKCLRFYNNSVYCLATIQLHPDKLSNSTKVWDIIQEVNLDRNNYRHDRLRHGVCASKMCDKTNDTITKCLSDIYRTKYQNSGLLGEVVKLQCETKNSRRELTTDDFILAAILGPYIGFVLFVSFYLKISKNEKPSKVRQFFSSFSLFENAQYLLDTKLIKIENYLPFIQGIRVVVAVGVIVTHATEINLITPVSNFWYNEDVPKRFVTMLLANGGMTVQVYFVVSSWLQAISFYKKLNENDKVHFSYVWKYAIRRYIRFTPALALLIALKSTWLVHLSRGPFWEAIMGEDYNNCRQNWWKNLLYFNNFVINDGMCMFHSWYLSVDFQFALLGALLLWLTQKKPKYLFLISAIVIIFQTIFLFFVLLWNRFEIAVVLTPEILYYFNVIYSKEWQATWTTTYSNLAGPVVGLCLGYLYVKYDKKIPTKMKYKFLWWVISWGLSLIPLVISSYYMITPYYGHSLWFSTIWGSICKSIFALGIGFIIFGMSQGFGGYIRKCLEWKPMYALGQLSFGVYLVHFVLLKIIVSARQAPTHVSDILMLSEIITNVGLSYICSIFLTLFILMPFSALAQRII